MRYIDALVTQASEAGLWVILAARAKYAAGWSGPDVWHSHEMRRQMLAMWAFVADRYKGVERIAGYEIMSEPRTKTVAQAKVRDFMREGCEAVHRSDPRALCVVGPRVSVRPPPSPLQRPPRSAPHSPLSSASPN